MTDRDPEDDEAEDDPGTAELLREIAAIGADPTEEGVQRLEALLGHALGMVRIRAAATMLDIGFGPAEEGEPIDEDEP